jgi:hypothetical protein
VNSLENRLAQAGVPLLKLAKAEETNLSYFGWFLAGVRNEVKGPRITWYSFWGEVRAPRFASLLIGSVGLTLFNLARAAVKPSWFVDVSRRLHSLTSKHVRALELFVEDPEADFLMVLEDDALLLTENPVDLDPLTKFLDSRRAPSVVNLCAHFVSRQNGPAMDLQWPMPTSPFFDTSAAYAVDKQAARQIIGEFRSQHHLSFVSADWALTIAARGSATYSRMILFLNGSLVAGYSSLGSPTYSFFENKT